MLTTPLSEDLTAEPLFFVILGSMDDSRCLATPVNMTARQRNG
jgi:hypothetical protein